MNSQELAISLHGPDAVPVPAVREEMLSVHADARAEQLDRPFYSLEQYGARIDLDTAEPGFGLAAGHVGGRLVGYAFGISLSEDTWWWQYGVDDRLDPDLTRETGQRTFCVRELLVRQQWQRHGFGRQLHDALLRNRPEERATLTVQVDNPARDLYLKWGYREVGQRRAPDTPPLFYYDSRYIKKTL